jgi:hypothetical protein
MIGLIMGSMGEVPISVTSVSRIPLETFAGQCQRKMQPLVDRISYFSEIALDEEQVRQNLREPAEATPRSLLQRISPIRLVLVPYLEKGPAGSTDFVTFERPANPKVMARSSFALEEAVFLFLAAESQEVADYHYWFYNGVAELAVAKLGASELGRFSSLVAEELNRSTRGEVDERSYHLKQKLGRKQRLAAGGDSKLMKEYVNQAFEDTLTLYLHGLCCDIDVDPGPRQLASRYLRKRLELLSEIFPANNGASVFPTGPRVEPAAENPEE